MTVIFIDKIWNEYIICFGCYLNWTDFCPRCTEFNSASIVFRINKEVLVYVEHLTLKQLKTH